jgi:hypothetical protein
MPYVSVVKKLAMASLMESGESGGRGAAELSLSTAQYRPGTEKECDEQLQP